MMSLSVVNVITPLLQHETLEYVLGHGEAIMSGIGTATLIAFIPNVINHCTGAFSHTCKLQNACSASLFRFTVVIRRTGQSC